MLEISRLENGCFGMKNLGWSFLFIGIPSDSAPTFFIFFWTINIGEFLFMNFICFSRRVDCLRSIQISEQTA